MSYRYDEQHTPPEPTRVSDVAITTFEHVFEVDPRLMQEWVTQQEFPNWDTLRIMNSRHDHLDWMHEHFAHKVIHASELLASELLASELQASELLPADPQPNPSGEVSP